MKFIYNATPVGYVVNNESNTSNMQCIQDKIETKIVADPAPEVTIVNSLRSIIESLETGSRRTNFGFLSLFLVEEEDVKNGWKRRRVRVILRKPIER